MDSIIIYYILYLYILLSSRLTCNPATWQIYSKICNNVQFENLGSYGEDE